MKNYDVAVCGGGFAGISAALAAAREGKKVVLFEKEYMLGGLGTAGLITIYLPLCDGYGRQVSVGIAEELLKLSITYGAEDRYPANWLDGIGTRTENDTRYMVQYNAQLCAILLEKRLKENGVDIMYGSYAVDTDTENGRITTLYVQNKSGRIAYPIRTVVDATGDCDIAHFAGVATEVYRPGNKLAAWYYFTDEAGYRLQQLGVVDEPGQTGESLTNRRFSGLDGKEISEMVCLSHERSLKHWLQKRENDPAAVMSTLATIPQIRMTRRIVGEYELADTEMHKYFADSIGMVSDWKKRGPIYEVPFGTLYNKEMKNLIVAGRCTSVNDALWDSMRVIPCCAVTGQAAGTAAAMTDDFSALDISALQKKLAANGVKLHETEIL